MATYQDFYIATYKSYKQNPGWRIGQSLFNTLLDMRPDLAEKIRGTEVDPFYDDNQFEKFFTFVYENWES